MDAAGAAFPDQGGPILAQLGPFWRARRAGGLIAGLRYEFCGDHEAHLVRLGSVRPDWRE
jgi:hypothetical protein